MVEACWKGFIYNFLYSTYVLRGKYLENSCYRLQLKYTKTSLKNSICTIYSTTNKIDTCIYNFS